MKELKTLKDFEHQDHYAKDEFTHGMNSENESLIEELKAEAIKWVKSERVEGKYLDYFPAVTKEQKDWIKHFFNLSEEDLK